MNPDDRRARPRDALLTQVHEALDRADDRRARRLLRKLGSTQEDPAVAYARWRLECLGPKLEPALELAEQASSRFPQDPDLHHARGWTLLELGRAEEASHALEEACYLDPDFGDAWHDLALARELLGDLAGMKQAFAEVWEIDEGLREEPMFFDRDRVERWAERALSQLPAEIQRACRDVPIILEDYPDRWILEDHPWDPRLLGLFMGLTRSEEVAGSVGNEGAMLALQRPHIYLFQRNLERVCGDQAEMIEQIRITVHHELGHYLGLDEHDLDERGLA